MKAVFVDMGETLVKFKPKYHENVIASLKSLNIEVEPRLVYRSLMRQWAEKHFPEPNVGLSNVDFKDLFFKMGMSIPDEKIKELESKSFLSSEYDLYDDAIDFLEGVRKMGLKVVMITNTTPKVHEIVKNLNLMRYLDGIVASCDVGIMKPHPKIFYRAVEVAGSSGIHVGDSYEIDVLGAKRAYLDAILLDREGFYPEIKENKVKNLIEALDIIKGKINCP
ncbi:HAD family hydrolase [Candidatus Acidianus copahuensis]|uniref:2-haloalkanoic acid dehalogenase n=1 Tax=Candidatus Acidianus copahuensis TaxID=1160895 RepID=A0A031LJX7_9CREN|nr:HAD family hydrolase [Candidatus Acidianus copahuensis]EZQ01821.1 2-haloalkanoic acid dehalogenase [Candidatus Acidianus copahuensis]NON61782.1 HAD family hydrolase [Acidianus sp. RZ1]